MVTKKKWIPDFNKENPYEGAPLDYLRQIEGTEAFKSAVNRGWITELPEVGAPVLPASPFIPEAPEAPAFTPLKPVAKPTEIESLSKAFQIPLSGFVPDELLKELALPPEQRTTQWRIPYEQYLTPTQARSLGFDVPEGSIVKMSPLSEGEPTFTLMMRDEVKPSPELIRMLKDIYPERFTAATYGITEAEKPQVILEQILTAIQTDYQGLVSDLYERVGEVEAANFLKALGVSEEYILGALDYERQEERINTTIQSVFPELDMSSLISRLETDFDSFIEDIQTDSSAKLRDKRTLLEQLGFEPVDINEILRYHRRVEEVDGVRQFITYDVNTNSAFNQDGDYIGKYSFATRTLTAAPAKNWFQQQWDTFSFFSNQYAKGFYGGVLNNLSLLYPDWEWLREDVRQQNKVAREQFRNIYGSIKRDYNEWELKHPEQKPSTEYLEGALQHPELLKDPNYWVHETVSMLPFVLASIGTTIATGGVGGGYVVLSTLGMGAVEAGGVYDDLVNAGATPDQAAGISAIAGTVIGGLESVGRIPLLKQLNAGLFGKFKRRVAGELARQTLSQVVKRFGTDFTAVMASEVATEIAQEIIGNIAVSFYDENRGVFENVPDIAVKTAVATASMAILGAGTSSIRMVSPNEQVGLTDAVKRAKGWVGDNKGNWFEVLNEEGGFIVPGAEPGGERMTVRQRFDRIAELEKKAKTLQSQQNELIDKADKASGTERTKINRQIEVIQDEIASMAREITNLKTPPRKVTPPVTPEEGKAPLTEGLQQEYTELIENAEKVAPENPTVQKARNILDSITVENQRESLIQIEALEDELKGVVGVPVTPEVPIRAKEAFRGGTDIQKNYDLLARYGEKGVANIKQFSTTQLNDFRKLVSQGLAETWREGGKNWYRVSPITPEVTPPVTEVEMVEEAARLAEERALEAEQTRIDEELSLRPPIPLEVQKAPKEVIIETVREQTELTEPKDTVQKLTDLIKLAEPIRNITESLKHEELSKRSGRAAGILRTSEGREAFEKSTAALRGELPKADFSPPELQMTHEDITDLFNKIRDSELRYFDKLNTAEALEAVLSGNIPTRGQISLLESFFGEGLAKALLDKRTLGAKVWENVLDLMNLPRAVLASWDLSAPLRQGATLFWGQPKQSIPALLPMVKAFASENNARIVDEIIKTGRYADLRQQAGLYIAPLFGVSATLTEREESFMSRFAQKVPLVKASERAYVVYLNKLRADVFDSYAAQWENTGKTMKDYKALANAINILSGRGPLGGLSRSAPILSAVLFSPRYQMSRIMLPIEFLRATPVVRKMMARNIVAFVAANFTMLGLLSLGGADVEDDPRSSDFGKVKIENTRLDFWAGFQQYARAITQIITGIRKNSTTGALTEVERSELIGNFARSKLSPVFGLVSDILKGESFVGDELSLEPEAIRQQAFERLVPMFIQDLVEAIEDSGIAGGFAAIPGMFGVGVQTYGGGYWSEEIDNLGQPKESDTLPYSVNYDDIYTTKDLWSFTIPRIRGVELDKMTDQYGYPEMVKSIAEARDIKDIVNERPGTSLVKINADINEGDTFEHYYLQWQDYQKAKDKEKWLEENKEYDKYYMGNFSHRELALLREYHSLDEDAQKAFLEEHPELDVNPRTEYLRSHPKENALFALWGQGKIYSREAYSELQKLIKDYDIPDKAMPDLTLPPDGSADNYFDYQEKGSELGYNSYEVQLILAQDDALREWLGREPVSSTEVLELKVANRNLDSQSPEYKENTRKIEALEHNGSDFQNDWVDRGKTVDEFGGGSSEAKVWLLDHPEVHRWAVESGLLTDDGSTWNAERLRLNVELKEAKEGTPEYEELSLTKQAYDKGIPESLHEDYIYYNNLPTVGYKRDRYLQNNLPLAGVLGVDVPDVIPSIEYDNLYDEWQEEFDKYEEVSSPEKQQMKFTAGQKTYFDVNFENTRKLSGFGLAVITRQAHYELKDLQGDPNYQNYISSYVQWMALQNEGKPVNWKDKVGTDKWYEDDWFLMGDKDFYQNVYLKAMGNERKDFRNVPARRVFEQYLRYLDLPQGRSREDYRRGHLDLDSWLVTAFGYKSITEQEETELTPYQKAREALYGQEYEWEKRLEEIEKTLAGLK